MHNRPGPREPPLVYDNKGEGIQSALQLPGIETNSPINLDHMEVNKRMILRVVSFFFIETTTGLPKISQN